MKITQLLAIALIVIFIFFLGKSLFYVRQQDIDASLVNQTIPTVDVTSLTNPQQSLSDKDFKQHVSLLTFWATWCEACLIEHDMLMKIKNDYGIPIYGMLYKDNAQDALSYLQKSGNPFVKVGNDSTGNVGIEFGIFGTPQTFIVNQEGKIIYRQLGIINEVIWNDTLLPIIKANQS